MRKLWYAGAVAASGFVLFGATPAQADLLPGTGTAEQQADERLADLLGQSNGIDVQNPLRYSTMGQTPLGNSPVMQFKSGQNSPDLNPLLPGESANEPRPSLPAADVVGGALQRPGSALQRPAGNSSLDRLNLQQLPLRNLLGGLPLFGLAPDGRFSGAAIQQPATARQAEHFDGGLPLLGGLGGLMPVNELPRTAPAGDKPDTSGLPAGGMAVLPAATTPPAFGDTKPDTSQVDPAADKPKQDDPAPAKPAKPGKPAGEKPRPAVEPEDPRLHEEPVEGEASQRPFSPDGRPIAGIDEEYK
ncbi:hypothetical protein [Paractinoplanes rishiriensis]|uniref:Uncharacterized protein n=1 Tax=Paractinoplanes rishiriensis TaxID=1050105 RepID=A0A919N1W3_9ACTN|nr:hypothetical protein [Actinoplanes rishiriensis]GIE97972.1 hypothetical protein Ari01nite_54370 [Actinoplanes rishiriensis]